jgi:hypothetical protein
MAQYGVTPEGFKSKNYQICLTEIVTVYKNKYPDFKEHESNALYLQAQAQANQEEQLWNTLEAVYNSQFVLTSEHTALDYKTVDRIGPRGESTYASGKVTISGSVGTKILQGELLRTSEDSGLRFRILASYTIPSGGSLEVEVQCTTSGISGNLFAHTIVSFVNTKVGITNVDNSDILVGGREAETDIELRERYFASLQDFRGSNVPAIAARLRRVPDIIAYKIRENKTSNTKTIEGISMTSHSIGVTVIGGIDLEVGKALFTSKAGGINDLGTTSIKVPDVDGTEYNVGFTRGKGTPLNAKLELVTTDFFLGNNIEVIKEQLAKYINELSIEEDFLYNQSIAKAFSCVDEVTSFNLYVGKGSSPTGQVDIKAAQHEKFIIDISDITITRS